MPQINTPTRTSKPWKLVWHDEFTGRIGSRPRGTRWTYDIGNEGWGNKELEVYTDHRENAHIVADPDAGGGKALAITALRTAAGGYTSARLKTQDRCEWTYGRFEGRIKIPGSPGCSVASCQGVWPAFWLLGNDIETKNWPRCGEIDIMEWIGSEPGKLHATLHGPGYCGDKGLHGVVALPARRRYHGEYHVFAVEWSASVIQWFLDGVLYHTVARADLPAGKKWVFDHPFFLIINLAIGGSWPGYPTDATLFPQSLHVDYIRVYEANCLEP